VKVLKLHAFYSCIISGQYINDIMLEFCASLPVARFIGHVGLVWKFGGVVQGMLAVPCARVPRATVKVYLK